MSLSNLELISLTKIDFISLFKFDNLKPILLFNSADTLATDSINKRKKAITRLYKVVSALVRPRSGQENN